MATTTFVISNNVNTTLATAATSSSTTLTLASSANLPTLSAGQVMPLTLNDAATGQIYEVVYVTAISGVTLTVTRAQEGTGAQNWNIGDFAYCAPTAGTVAMINGNPANQFQVAPATQPAHAVQLGQLGNAGVVPGRLLRTSVYRNQGGVLTVNINGSGFSPAGTNVFTPLAATSAVRATVLGAGGAGAGAPATASGQVSFGSGGAAGGFAIKWMTSGFNGVTVTVGAAGAPISGTNGGTGGTSSFGSISATGGGGGVSSPATAPSGNPSGASIPGAGVAADVNGQGSAGIYGWSFGVPLGGAGGAGLYGGAGIAANGSSNGFSGGAVGSGGGGASNAQGQVARPGGTGIDGTIIIEEYA